MAWNYEHLVLFGNCYPINFTLNDTHSIVNTIEEKFDFVRYNHRKPIDRWGLSVTSLDGEMSGIPDLDSLREYNKENDVRYEEEDFNVPTLAYPYFKEVLSPFEPWLFRTHILKLNPGGFFPPHRDAHDLESFRLIVPLKNCAPPGLNFILEDKILNLKNGVTYFVDTVKMHYLFNATLNPSYMLVMNVKCTKEAVEKIVRNLNVK
tara:strand:- start:1430 stop:2047 length:618 start_codon:yes stop_codon:yes gene_type:complete